MLDKNSMTRTSTQKEKKVISLKILDRILKSGKKVKVKKLATNSNF